MFCIYPFYMEQGYIDLGKAKFHFFLIYSLGAGAILAILWLAYFLVDLYRKYRQKQTYLIDWSRISSTDLFVLMYATVIFLSYVYTDYRQEALWGAEGWYIGLVLWLMLCGLYFLISRLWRGNVFVWYIAIIASGVVFLLGILDRFSLYLVPIEVRQPEFVSTIGNINWFCGYLSVLSPISISLFIFQEGGNSGINSKRKWLCAVFSAIAFMAGFSQGSSSIFLFWIALFVILLWISVQRRQWLADWFLMIALCSFSAQLVRLMRFLLPGNYNYDTDTLCGALTDSNLTIFAGAGALIILFLIKGKQFEIDSKTGIVVHRIMMGILAAVLLIWGILSLVNTIVGIPQLAENSSFLWNRQWGNGRGMTLWAGFEAFKSMSLNQKLLGIGPDCFAAYTYSLPEIAAELRAYFGSSRLTNAHNELMTSMVNIGIVGTLLYLGIFISFILRCFKRGKERPFLYIAAVCVFCYLIHNMVSFAQVLNLPFAFLVMAMGESLMRDKYNAPG